MSKGISIEDEVRADIVRGVYAPSARLRLEELKDRFEVGFSPIREALSRLHAEGMVEFEPNRGFRVAPLSRADLVDIATARKAVETAALRLSIERGDEAWEGRLVGALHQYRRRSANAFDSEETLRAWEQAHDALHCALTDAAGSPRLKEMQERLQEQHLRYRRLIVIPQLSAQTHVEEHERLVELALARDAQTAVAEMERHLMITVDALGEGDFLETTS